MNTGFKHFMAVIFALSVIVWAHPAACADDEEEWRVGIGINFFKFSCEGKPKEINYNPVFDRWEKINQDKAGYTVKKYAPLEPLYFNFDFGIDIFARFKNKLLIKLALSASNPAGIGGKGEIEYVDNKTGVLCNEKKEFKYVSRQAAIYFGPVVCSQGGEVYMAFSPMPPVWVKYSEIYSKTENGAVTSQYKETFRGAFGNCRAVAGAQVETSDSVWLGSDVTFSFLNYMKLKSESGIEDSSFQFPNMKWNFTARKDI